MTPPKKQDAPKDLSPKQENKKHKRGQRPNPSDNKNLAFFVNILRTLKLNQSKLSQLSGTSQQLISWYLSSDDCKISIMTNIFKNLDMRLECNFSPLTDSPYTFSEENYAIKIDSGPILRKLSSKERDDVISRALIENVRTKFIAKFISNLGIDLPAFCRIVNISYSTFYKWFQKDDIRISTIYRIAEKMQQRVIWKLLPMS